MMLRQNQTQMHLKTMEQLSKNRLDFSYQPDKIC